MIFLLCCSHQLRLDRAHNVYPFSLKLQTISVIIALPLGTAHYLQHPRAQCLILLQPPPSSNWKYLDFCCHLP